METESTNRDLELFTSSIEILESSDDANVPKRAIVKIKLITEGDNKKHLRWTEDTMKKVAAKFRGVPFRYDLTGQNEGSHTRERISSPFYDVGWTYGDERGAFYDPHTKAIWAQGEVTHPDVISKLMRQTSDGKREINFASMGAMMKPEQTQCSICGKSPFGTCEHQRGEVYDGEVCAMVPTDISKALHVALTNDPADENAKIYDAIFQDMTNQIDSGSKDAPVGVSSGGQTPSNLPDDTGKLKEMIMAILKELEEKKKQELSESILEAKPMFDKPDLKKEEAPEIKKGEKVEKDKDTGNDILIESSESKEPKEEEKEGSEEDEKEDDEEKKKKKKKKGNSEEKVEVDKTSEDMKEEKKEVADNVNENTAIAEMLDSTEIRIKGVTGKPTNQIMEVADSSAKPVQQASTVDYSAKYKAKILSELADNYVKFGKASTRDGAITVLQDKSIEQLEIYLDAFSGLSVPHTAPAVKQAVKPVEQVYTQDDVPEYGGTVEQYDPYAELQDMTPSQRKEVFGEYGAWDLAFHPEKAHIYINKK